MKKDFTEVIKLIPEESWLHQWMTCWPVSEPPLSYVFFGAMAMMGASLGRKCWMDMDVHRTYPLMNLLLIGPSGIGKSTALRAMAVRNLIEPLPIGPLKPMVLAGKQTKEATHQDLCGNPHALIVASELANLFSKEKYNEGQLAYFTDLLDLERTRVRTKSGGEQIIEEPECALVGGSTREWLQEMLPSTAGEGGFLPRFLIVNETYRYQLVPDPSRALNPRQKILLDKHRDKTFNEFLHIIESADGRFDFEDYEASDAYSYWYSTFKPDTGALSAFAARAGAHVLRLSMLVAISRYSPAIAFSDVVAGIALYSYTQAKLAEVVIPMSPAGKLMAKLLDAMGTEERTVISLRRAMRNHCSGKDVDAMLMDLERNKEVVRTNESYRRTNL